MRIVQLLGTALAATGVLGEGVMGTWQNVNNLTAGILIEQFGCDVALWVCRGTHCQGEGGDAVRTICGTNGTTIRADELLKGYDTDVVARATAYAIQLSTHKTSVAADSVRKSGTDSWREGDAGPRILLGYSVVLAVLPFEEARKFAANYDHDEL